MENPHIEKILDSAPLINMLNLGNPALSDTSPGVKGLILKLETSNGESILKVGRLYLNDDATYEIQFSPKGQVTQWFENIVLDIPIPARDLHFYDNTVEFGLTFFPTRQINDLLNYGERSTTTGIKITRGLTSFPNKRHTSNKKSIYIMRTYRTLVARPEPDPVRSVSDLEVNTGPVSEDQALSLVIAPPCPPIWREQELLRVAVETSERQGMPITYGPIYKMSPSLKLRLAFGDFFKSTWNSLFGKKAVNRK
ncbi:MAG: hypothetical protein R3D00_23640 [Bacteroidia bacterium]